MIEVREFAKTFRVGFFRKKSVAATNISFEVARGEIFGFLGPNGAGKTTTIKALLGLIRPDNGTLKLCGHAPDSLEWRTKVGYMPEHPTFYDFLTGFEMVSWFGRLSGLSAHEAETSAKKLLERVGLGHAMQRRLRSYSKGMFQRAGLASSLVASPELLILDEPMGGLDPIGRKEIRELIVELAEEGKTIFYSTHILPDVEMTCSRVSIIDRGVTRRTGRLEDILAETTRGVVVVMRDLSDEAAKKLAEQFPALESRDGRHRIEVPNHDEGHKFVEAATAVGGVLQRFEPHRDDLESIFVRSLEHKEEAA